MSAIAFLLAGGAILLWSSLALIGSRLAHLPPILMTGIALTIGGMLGVGRVKEWRVPLPTLLLGVGGIFGYHVMLFTAFRTSPIVEANLINYLWPLLIVLLTPAILPGVGLKPRHVLGAVMGLAGAALIATGGSIHPDLAALPGYLLAAAAALTWALYSLLTKRMPPFGSGAVGAFCLAAGLLSLGVFFLQAGSGGFSTVRGSDWPFLLLLGIGPMGAAFLPLGRCAEARRHEDHRLPLVRDAAPVHPRVDADRRPPHGPPLGDRHGSHRGRRGRGLAGAGWKYIKEK